MEQRGRLSIYIFDIVLSVVFVGDTDKKHFATRLLLLLAYCTILCCTHVRKKRRTLSLALHTEKVRHGLTLERKREMWRSRNGMVEGVRWDECDYLCYALCPFFWLTPLAEYCTVNSLTGHHRYAPLSDERPGIIIYGA